MTFLTPSRKNARYFQDPAGYPVYLSGYSGRELFLRNDAPYRSMLDRLGEAGLNAALVPIDAQDRDPSVWMSPFKRIPGGRRTAQGFRRFDLRALNPSYFEKLSALVQRAQRSGIFVGIGLFGLPGDRVDKAAWAASAWNPANHADGESSGGARDSEAFVRESQRGLADAVLESVTDSSNVFFYLTESAAESPEAAKERVRALFDAGVAPLLPLQRESDSAREEGAGFAGGFSSPQEIRPLSSAGILLLEDGAEDPVSERRIREAAWIAFLSGAQTFRRLPLQDAEASASLRAAGSVRRFVKERRARFWTMIPAPKLAGGLPCLCRADDRYLVYAAGGEEFPLDLAGCSGSFTVSWWQPEEERMATQGMILGGGTRSLKAPDDREWVLDLFKKIR